jgi:hypothetical protein
LTQRFELWNAKPGAGLLAMAGSGREAWRRGGRDG